MENTRFTRGMEQLKTIDGKGGKPQLEVHINGALNVGISPEKMIETLLQCISLYGISKSAKCCICGEKGVLQINPKIHFLFTFDYWQTRAQTEIFMSPTKGEFVYLLFRFTSSISAISSANGRYSPPHHSKTCMPSSSSTDSISIITVL